MPNWEVHSAAYRFFRLYPIAAVQYAPTRVQVPIPHDRRQAVNPTDGPILCTDSIDLLEKNVQATMTGTTYSSNVASPPELRIPPQHSFRLISPPELHTRFACS